MLSTVGRGGDGQRIRDEILHIIHRNKVKEVHGEWLEAWRQKLHNNTTPDDVPICEAYIKFMESNGDERVEGYDRPVVNDPQFYPDKEGLVRDMYNYLCILKNVHSGADFQSDSNGEDLEGYAGAGLCESITMDTTELRKVDYVGDRLIKDSRFRTDLLSGICKGGAAIENALSFAQDVKGVVSSDGKITVVQTQP
eukprot:g7972.t1